jgi:GNAT superfamily N-acetyltransferase
MLTIYQAESDEDRRRVQKLVSEYLYWASTMLDPAVAAQFDLEAMIAKASMEIGVFYPPQGRLLIAMYDDALAGIACLQPVGERIAEVKRMYVRPSVRGLGIGRALLERIIAEARQIGYSTLRLDSARFMTAAHQLYRSAGFKDTDPYPESEIPAELHPQWVYMELALESEA